MARAPAPTAPTAAMVAAPVRVVSTLALPVRRKSSSASRRTRSSRRCSPIRGSRARPTSIDKRSCRCSRMAKSTEGEDKVQAGQSLTELPIVLVLFVVLTFGIVDAGRLIYAYNVVSSSAREGVRYAVVRGGTSGREATTADVTAYVQSKTAGIPVAVTATWNPDNQPGSTVAVTVTNAFAPIAPFPFVPKSINLTSTSNMDLPLSTCGIAMGTATRESYA